mmetsp:Transcript_80505/g.260770  ORF Transcript_80505/g.260770 Transcript_80505/m.260770 type:complete len:308 (-) Transcript_80505:403-1326(-)
MRVRVQRARLQEHGEVGGHGDEAELGHVLRRGELQALPVDPLGGQHLRGGTGGDDGRREHRPSQGCLLDGLLEVSGVLGLLSVVQFSDEALAPCVDDTDEVAVHARVRDPEEPLQWICADAQEIQVQRNDVLHARTLHFDSYLWTIPHRRPIDLPQRGRSDGLLRNLHEELPHGEAQLGLNDLVGLLRGKRRHPVLQLLQRHQVCRRQQVCADRGGLTDLDEGRPKSREHAREFPSPGHGVGLGAACLLVDKQLRAEASELCQQLQGAHDHRQGPSLEVGCRGDRVVHALRVGGLHGPDACGRRAPA